MQPQRHLVARDRQSLGSLQRLGSLPLEGHRQQRPSLGASLLGRGLSAGYLMPGLVPVCPHQAFSAQSISSKHQGHSGVQVRAVHNADMLEAGSHLHCTQPIQASP